MTAKGTRREETKTREEKRRETKEYWEEKILLLKWRVGEVKCSLMG